MTFHVRLNSLAVCLLFAAVAAIALATSASATVSSAKRPAKRNTTPHGSITEPQNAAPTPKTSAPAKPTKAEVKDPDVVKEMSEAEKGARSTLRPSFDAADVNNTANNTRPCPSDAEVWKWHYDRVSQVLSVPVMTAWKLKIIEYCMFHRFDKCPSARVDPAMYDLFRRCVLPTIIIMNPTVEQLLYEASTAKTAPLDYNIQVAAAQAWHTDVVMYQTKQYESICSGAADAVAERRTEEYEKHQQGASKQKTPENA